ncbi:hypothetical protein QR680_018928 [Steinernema hermaphroditum]|uniref:Uncharacterized protein n=1 Tax=Steinernema hermaphroditum TaxID=289476 RepID=A0AA39LRI0_9BILA|nr:hypothetical protein QR680_018928 [Steinernema hermaphroditum]
MPSQASTYRAKREKERDISEKIALGLPDTRAHAGETQFDQRLFTISHGVLRTMCSSTSIAQARTSIRTSTAATWTRSSVPTSSFREVDSQKLEARQLKRERCREDDGAFSSKKGRK